MGRLRSLATLPSFLCLAATTLIAGSVAGGLIDGVVCTKEAAGDRQVTEPVEKDLLVPGSQALPLQEAGQRSLVAQDSGGRQISHTGPASCTGASSAPALSWTLVDSAGKPIYASCLSLAGDDLYFLDAGLLWCVAGGKALLSRPQRLCAERLQPAGARISGIPVQEFSSLVFCQGRDSLEILDKSGDIFEFSLRSKNFAVLRPNHPTTGSPDPEYIDMASLGGNLCLLDPERNQIWRYPGASKQYFKEVLPWRLGPGCASVADGIGIAFDGATYVLRRSGAISKYQASASGGLAVQVPFPLQGVRAIKGVRPSRLYTRSDSPLYIVERENNRVLSVDKKTGAVCQFLFPADSDLRGLLPGESGFWIIDGQKIVFRHLCQSDSMKLKPEQRRMDYRLSGLLFPLKGGSLPRHPGVWPGARRLYRYGVHKGTDFFNDPGGGTLVSMETPVFAADAAKVVRADADFHDMTAVEYARVIGQCRKEHISSEDNENLLRGCQVWLDHGNGLMTKYAHLDRIRPGLKPGMKVAPHDLIGYVGVSGTGENLSGRLKHPHLHFEVWLDGKYLGFGLTPAETIGLYEDIFGVIGKRGNS